MNNKPKDYVLFYTEYVRNGKQHFSVNKYCRTSGIVEYPTDYIYSSEDLKA